MDRTFDITILGGAELQKKFSRLSLKMQRRLLKNSLPTAAEPIAIAARALAPVETGRLAISIHVSKPRMSRDTMKVAVITGTREELGIDPEATGFYPMAQETGWIDQYGHHHAAKPYMRPALHANEERAKEIIRNDLASNLGSLVQ